MSNSGKTQNGAVRSGGGRPAQPSGLISTASLAGALLVGLAKEPNLIPVAVREMFRLARPRWWAQAPFLPLPPVDYRRFRFVTLSGDPEQLPSAEETIVWLRWCRQMRSTGA